MLKQEGDAIGVLIIIAINEHDRISICFLPPKPYIPFICPAVLANKRIDWVWDETLENYLVSNLTMSERKCQFPISDETFTKPIAFHFFHCWYFQVYISRYANQSLKCIQIIILLNFIGKNASPEYIEPINFSWIQHLTILNVSLLFAAW